MHKALILLIWSTINKLCNKSSSLHFIHNNARWIQILWNCCWKQTSTVPFLFWIKVSCCVENSRKFHQLRFLRKKFHTYFCNANDVLLFTKYLFTLYYFMLPFFCVVEAARALWSSIILLSLIFIQFTFIQISYFFLLQPGLFYRLATFKR